MTNQATNLTKTPEEILLDLINGENGTDLKPSIIEFDTPTALPDGSFRNTQINLNPAVGSTLKGGIVIFYNRENFADIAKDQSVVFSITNERMLSDLIPAINARYGINLTPDDYMEVAFPELSPQETGIITLEANTASLIYWGSIDLTIQDVTVINPIPADTAPPVVSLTASSVNVAAEGSITLTATASDDTGVASVKFYRAGGLIATLNTGPYQITEAYTAVDDGTISYTATAFDAAGNNATSTAVDVVVNIAVAQATDMTIDATTTSEINAAIAAASAGSKRMAAANAIVAAMTPAHKLTVSRNGSQVFEVTYLSDLTVVHTTGVYVGLGVEDSISTIVPADIDTGVWAFALTGGSGYVRQITGSVGPVGSGADLILSGDTTVDMGFTQNILLQIPDSLDTL